MKITDMRCQLYTAPYADERTPTPRSYGVVAITTEDGRTGYGEPYAAVNMPTVFREIVEQFKPLITNQDAELPDVLLRQLYRVAEYFDHRGMVYCCIGAIDWALHDLAAQREGLPMYRFLNPTATDSVQVYASAGPCTQTPSGDVREYREGLHLWPLSPDRRSLLEPIVVRDTIKEWGLTDKGTKIGSIRQVDHHTGRTVRLKDGKWRHILAYRVWGKGEAYSGMDRDATTIPGVYVDEVLSEGEPHTEWQF